MSIKKKIALLGAATAFLSGAMAASISTTSRDVVEIENYGTGITAKAVRGSNGQRKRKRYNSSYFNCSQKKYRLRMRQNPCRYKSKKHRK